MKQEIDNIFYSSKVDRNASSADKIAYLETVYNSACDYILSSDLDDDNKRRFIDYAHILFSKKLLECVKIDDYVVYLNMRDTIDSVNEHVVKSRYQGPKM